MAQSLFRVFDEDNSGKLTFYEFVQVNYSPLSPIKTSYTGQANNVKNLESPEDKLGWMFDAFDADGGGTVDRDEITDIVIGLFRLGGIEEDQDLLAACVFDVAAYRLIFVSGFWSLSQYSIFSLLFQCNDMK